MYIIKLFPVLTISKTDLQNQNTPSTLHTQYTPYTPYTPYTQYTISSCSRKDKTEFRSAPALVRFLHLSDFV